MWVSRKQILCGFVIQQSAATHELARARRPKACSPYLLCLLAMIKCRICFTSVATDMSPTGDLRVILICLGRCPFELARTSSRVAPALQRSWEQHTLLGNDPCTHCPVADRLMSLSTGAVHTHISKPYTFDRAYLWQMHCARISTAPTKWTDSKASAMRDNTRTLRIRKPITSL